MAGLLQSQSGQSGMECSHRENFPDLPGRDEERPANQFLNTDEI